MAKLPHLILPQVKFESPRKKTGFGRTPDRSFRAHGRVINSQINKFLGEFQSQPKPKEIDPTLILRVHLDPQCNIEENIWERCGLTLLSVDQDKTFILFSSDHELTQFRDKLALYRGGANGRTKECPA